MTSSSGGPSPTQTQGKSACMHDPANLDEKLRIEDLRSFNILDTPAEQAYDDVVSLASFICDTPIALISLVDEDRQWFKARLGLSAMETPRGQAFCAHAIVDPDRVMEVPDALQDARFVDNPLVTGDPGIRFYAGAPLLTPSGAALGTVCVIDKVPRKLTERQSEALRALSRQVVQLLALRRANAELELVAKAQTLRQQQLENHQRRIEELNQDLQEQTLTDPLTALKNRRAFETLLANEFARSQRSKSPLCLLMVDADHFKAYNDAFGHVAGDQALMFVSLAIKSQARAYDHVARYGGEEFCVILPDTKLNEALVVAERIRESIKSIIGLRRPMTGSIGVAYSEGVPSPKRLVELADRAMYLAKQGGRDRVEIFLPPV
ncbi:GGDEF domain-containing protein [Curvibacter sp. AEP1-3]|uniref:GGDEF domain-containing protein n=1 Tax=Curvibacter sp. AEP1-3 TaxID=1844971 RepID=UPI001E478137|nr:sensor domain-containing diguanylate cyclase [Curvibacter sp. AEP1-3]